MFTRFGRLNRWMPKICSTPVLAILGVLAAGFPIVSKPIKIHQISFKSIKINEHQYNSMIIATNQMQFHENHQRKRKSKSNSCLHIRFVRISAVGCPIASKSIKIYQNQPKFIKFIKINAILWKSYQITCKSIKIISSSARAKAIPHRSARIKELLPCSVSSSSSRHASIPTPNFHLTYSFLAGPCCSCLFPSMLTLRMPGWYLLAPAASFIWLGKQGRVGFTRRAK